MFNVLFVFFIIGFYIENCNADCPCSNSVNHTSEVHETIVFDDTEEKRVQCDSNSSDLRCNYDTGHFLSYYFDKVGNNDWISSIPTQAGAISANRRDPDPASVHHKLL